jgi:CelD/BcsL family acetyltransferase involved in cellulose biosynthesis
MAALAPAWQALADRALEANPFYEPSFLLPLIEETGPYPGLQFWVVAPRDAPGDVRGVFPFDRRRARPMTMLSPFTRGRSGGQHIDIDVGVPLVDAVDAGAVIDALLDFLDARWLHALDWYALAEGASFHQALLARLVARAQPMLDLGGWARPLFRAGSDIDAYLGVALSKRRRTHVRQYRTYLTRVGEIGFSVLGRDDDPGPWIATYFALEASGWKGREGSDVGATTGARRFFERAMRARHAHDGLFAYRLSVGDRPIAQTWVLQPADRRVGLTWKMSYDEEFAKNSPGLLLEIAAMGLLHTDAAPLRTVDSCAHSRQRLFSWLWQDRRQMACLLIVARTPLHDAALRLAARFRAWRMARRMHHSEIAVPQEDEP